MKTFATVLITGLSLVALQAVAQNRGPATAPPTMGQSAAQTYEHLATAIIAIENTEDELVRSILMGYNAAAQVHLRAAARGDGDRRTHLEAAATEIANIANEGDKRIQAVRQRLSKAGHTHNTDTVTKEDYMFVDSKEKKDLLALSRRVAQLSGQAGEIGQASQELDALFTRVIAAE